MAAHNVHDVRCGSQALHPRPRYSKGQRVTVLSPRVKMEWPGTLHQKELAGRQSGIVSPILADSQERSSFRRSGVLQNLGLSMKVFCNWNIQSAFLVFNSTSHLSDRRQQCAVFREGSYFSSEHPKECLKRKPGAVWPLDSQDTCEAKSKNFVGVLHFSELLQGSGFASTPSIP